MQFWAPDLRVGGAEVSLVEEVKVLRSLGVEVSIAILGSHADLRGECERNGIKVWSAESKNILGRLARIVRTLRSEKPDVVNTMLFGPNVLVRPIARLLGLRVMTTLVNDDYGRRHREGSKYGAVGVRLAQLADIVTSQFASHFRAVSDGVAESMSRRLLVSRKKITTIHRGRDLGALGVRTEERRRIARQDMGLDDKVAFLNLGRQNRQKAQEIAVQAFAQSKFAASDAVLLIVGRPGDNTEKLTSAVRQLSDSTHVRLLDESRQIGDLMSACDFLLSTSLWEGLPGVVIEAMALELPLLLSDISGSREVADESAIYFRAGSVEACRSMLDGVWESGYPSGFVERAKARALDEFNINQVGQALNSLIRSTARQRRT